MQGNLNEIDTRSLLQLIELGQRTGQLLVETNSFHNSDKLDGCKEKRHHHSSNCKQQRWLIFFWNGEIIYCQEGNNSLSRIGDYLRHYRIQMPREEIQLDLGAFTQSTRVWLSLGTLGAESD